MKRSFLLSVAVGVVVACACTSWKPSPNSAQGAETESTSPLPPRGAVSPGSRILKTFNFEERSLGNFENTPMFWAKVSGRGYPAFASGRFDTSIFRPHGKDEETHNSFRLDIDSGSVAYRFTAPGAYRIPVNSHADYYILGFVKTTPMKHARAEIGAWYADADGNLLPSTEMHSDRFAARPGEAETGAWHVLHLYMPGPKPAGTGDDESAKAKYLVLQVGLLQPQQLSAESGPSDSGGNDPNASNLLGKFALYQQDIKGSAWFDDITVFQLPRVSVEVPRNVVANVFAPGQPINLDLMVSDLAQNAEDHESSLNVSLRITDADGLIYAGDRWPVHTTPDMAWTHHYTHAPLPPGAYVATLDIADQTTGTLIARRQAKFVSLSTLPMQRNAGGKEKVATEFGWTATGWPTAAWGELPTVMRESGIGLLQLPAWRRDMPEEALRRRDPAFDAMINAMERMNGRVLGAFSELPAVLAEKLDDAKSGGKAGELSTLADADPGLWRPYASFLLARYSNLVQDWEIGSPATPFSGQVGIGTVERDRTDPYPKLYANTFRELSGLMNRPRLVVPWNALFDFDERLYPRAILDLQIPSVIKPAQIPSYIRNFQEASMETATGHAKREHDIFVHIDSLDADSYSHADRDADFAQRVIYARSANPTAILTDLPLVRCSTISSGSTHSEPDELLLIYRTLARTLGGTTFQREIRIAAGIKAFLFVSPPSAAADNESESEPNGILVLWNESAPDPRVLAELPLGVAPESVELNGRTRALQPDPKTSLTRVLIGSSPVILRHVDPSLIQLRASFALGSSNLPAGAGLFRTDVRLSNPYATPLSATLHLEGPTGWSIDPPSIPVAIPAGGDFKHPITIRYPYTEVAGPKSVDGTLSSDSEGSGWGGHPLALSYPVAVRSDTVDIDGFARILPNGDLIVQAMVTNLSSGELNSEAYALVPGYARQQRFVLNLGAGQTTIKRFVFPIATNVKYDPKATEAANAALLAKKAVTLGLRQADGRTLITKAFPLN